MWIVSHHTCELHRLFSSRKLHGLWPVWASFSCRIGSFSRISIKFWPLKLHRLFSSRKFSGAGCAWLAAAAAAISTPAHAGLQIPDIEYLHVPPYPLYGIAHLSKYLGEINPPHNNFLSIPGPLIRDEYKHQNKDINDRGL